MRRFSLRMSCRLQANQSHNAHHFEMVTVYYRWHPLFGQSLPVQKRQKDRHGDYIFVRLPNDTTCGLPKWMFSSECAEFVIGSPVIAVDALLELRDLLSVLRAKPECDKPSLRPMPKEGKNEGTAEAASSATPSSAIGPGTDRTPRPQRRRTRPRAGGTSDRSSQQSKLRHAARKRRPR